MTWDLSDQQWSQTDAGEFAVVNFRGLGAPSSEYSPDDVARLTGARISYEPADRGPREVALYPGPFTYSPVTGRRLPDALRRQNNVWLPPFGLDGASASNTLYGLRLTSVPLALPERLTPESRPDVELSTPMAGNYQFVVGPFRAESSSLLAIEPSQGVLHCLLPASREWRPVALDSPEEGGDGMGGSSLPDHTWSMAADLQSTRDVFLPTDLGIAAVRINVLALTHTVTVAGSRCVAAPVLCQGQIYAPMQGDDGHLEVYAFRPAALRTGRHLPVRNIGDHRLTWTSPIVRARDILWMSPRGQLWLKDAGTQAAKASFIDWPPEITPRFEFGSPYVSPDGRLWQQCFEGEGSTGHFVFLQLGPQPERRPTNSPSLSTGSRSFKLAASLSANPWEEPKEEASAPADEIVIPLLESTSRSTVLCVRVPSTGSVASLFASEDEHAVTFELQGDRNVRFWTMPLARPWATRPFVFDGHLYLYHPDSTKISGWRLG